MSLIGIFRQIRCGAFPDTAPKMALGCSILVADSDRYDQVDIWIDLVDPDGKHVARVLTYAAMLVGGMGDPSMFDFDVDMANLTFDKPGDYQFSIFVLGVLVRTVDLNLFLAS
ncbi:MAG: hypothetical protein P4L46_13825 [Fimbriimonas sp.]|nr:hypothetical protein [Fimbriimonas sp.]